MGEAHNIYPNLNDQQKFRLIRSMKLKTNLLQRFKKEN